MIDSGRILPLKVLLKELKPPDKSSGGIILAPLAKPTTITGEVVLAGDLPPNSPFKDFNIKVGDKVLHSPHSFVEVEIENEKFRLINIQDCLFLY